MLRPQILNLLRQGYLCTLLGTLLSGQNSRHFNSFLRIQVVRSRLHVIKVGVDDEILVIQMPEGQPKYRCDDGAGDGRGRKHPWQVRIDDGRRGSQGDDGGDGRHEQVNAGNQALHILGRLCVSNAIGCHVDEDLGNCGDDGRDGIETNMYR